MVKKYVNRGSRRAQYTVHPDENIDCCHCNEKDPRTCRSKETYNHEYRMAWIILLLSIEKGDTVLDVDEDGIVQDKDSQTQLEKWF